MMEDRKGNAVHLHAFYRVDARDKLFYTPAIGSRHRVRGHSISNTKGMHSRGHGHTSKGEKATAVHWNLVAPRAGCIAKLRRLACGKYPASALISASKLHNPSLESASWHSGCLPLREVRGNIRQTRSGTGDRWNACTCSPRTRSRPPIIPSATLSPH